jgi:hypothetical protein
MDLLELGLLWPLCGACVIGREMAWRGVCRGAFLPRSGEPRRIAFPAHATKSNRYIGPVLAAKLGTLTIADALAFGLEPDSFVRPGTASMRSLRRAQFFLPERRLRSPRRAGDVARLQVPQSGSYRNRIRGRHLELSLWKPICPAANSKPRGKSPAEGFDGSRGRPGKPHKAAFGPRPIWRWVRWFKTTNAHRAQLAALRHKRALKALLGKAAKTTMDFMRRNRSRRAATVYLLLKHAGRARHARTQNWERLRRGARRPLRHSPYYARARPR